MDGSFDPSPAVGYLQRTMETSPWHRVPVETVARRLAVDPAHGLAARAAHDRHVRSGPNRLPEPPGRGIGTMFLHQITNRLTLVLLGAALLAGAVGDVGDTLIIAGVVLCNTLVGVLQEFRAEQSVAALRRMTVATARVRRDGTIHQIDAEAIVPGDVVVLEAGDRVPADGRVAFAAAAELDESPLTGESTPVPKSTAAIDADDVPVADRTNMAHMHTTVTRGRLELVVTAIGADSAVGRVATLLAETDAAPTPLQRELDALGHRLALVAVAAVAVMAGLAVWRGETPASIVLAAVALGVATIPEGLPAVVTVTLALGTRRLARVGAIVKRLVAVETLGATTVICSDKTGTLTRNRMTARRVYAGGTPLRVSGDGYDANGTITGEDGATPPDLRALWEAMVLCNDARLDDGRVIGDPTEGALLALAAKAGIDARTARATMPRIAELPFDSERKFMVTVHAAGGRHHLVAKGATDVLLPRCRAVAGVHGETPLDDSGRAAVEAEMTRMAAEGHRVLAIASRPWSGAGAPGSADLAAAAHDLTLLGLVGIIDPPRPESADAIARCRAAGIRPMMITGDHPATAAAIARALGIPGRVVSGATLDALSDADLARRLPELGVVARVSPEHKLRLVRALRASGAVVAMTGDGVNDAPALKGADIGVAMGLTGTDVTKEAAAMVLTNDDFATIVGAVHEGRAIYDNILTFVRFQLSTNFGAILTVLGAHLLGAPTPFSPLHLLWVNLIMDGPPAMALGVAPARDGLMREAPRGAHASLLPWPRLRRLFAAGVVMAAGTLGVLVHGPYATTDPRAATLAFTTFVLFQVANAVSVRDEHGSVLSPAAFPHRALCAALAAVVALQVAAVQWPAVAERFGTAPLTARDWALATAVAASVLIVDELRKSFRIPRPTPPRPTPSSNLEETPRWNG